MADQNGKAAMTSPEPRPFRRMRAGPQAADLTVDALIASLKNEAAAIKAKGISQYIHPGDAAVKEELKELLFPYLSSQTAIKLVDSDGEVHDEANEQVYSSFESEHTRCTISGGDGTMHCNVGAELALNLYCVIMSALKLGVTANDGRPTVTLEKVEGQASEAKPKKAGGFLDAYKLVATTVFNKDMQQRVIFGYSKPASFAKDFAPYGSNLNAKVQGFLQQVFPTRVLSSTGVHVLFNWNAHSLFAYHQDNSSDVTFIVNLAPAKSSFHVAGFRQSTVYYEPGDAYLFPSAAWHRSGGAQRRSVKVAYFYKLSPLHSQIDCDMPSSSSFVPTSEVDTKEEVKEEVKGEADARVKAEVKQEADAVVKAEAQADADSSAPQPEGTGDGLTQLVSITRPQGAGGSPAPPGSFSREQPPAVKLEQEGDCSEPQEKKLKTSEDGYNDASSQLHQKSSA